MSTILHSSVRNLPLAVSLQLRRMGPLGAIILLHVAFFFALQSGLLQRAAQALPHEVFASFIATDAPPSQPKSQAAALKTAAVVKRTMTVPVMAAPIVNDTPSPQAITMPSAAFAPADAPVADAPPAAQAPAAPAQPRTISSGVEYIQPPQPEYPAIAKRMREEGKVLLRVLVNEKGHPERAEIQKSSGSARLDDAARQSVMKALFKSYIEDGKPVAVFALVPIQFQLDN